MMRQVFGFQQQHRPELHHQSSHDEHQDTEEVPHLLHRIGDGHDPRADHRLYDRCDSEEEVW